LRILLYTSSKHGRQFALFRTGRRFFAPDQPAVRFKEKTRLVNFAASIE
jgi:hypothetical protein